MKNTTLLLAVIISAAVAFSMDAAAAKISVSRALPDYVSAESFFTVTLSMDVNESSVPVSAGLTEYYPASCNISNVSHGGLVNASAGKIEWLFWQYGVPVQDREITYVLHVPASAGGTYWFSGNIDIAEGSPIETTGDDWVTITPYRITVTRDLPSKAYTNESFTVNLYLDVSEEKKPNAIGVVEYFPHGWQVSNISNGGILRNTSIEWLFSSLTTPVSDANISYVLSVPAIANGTYTFSGQFNYSTTYGPMSQSTTGDASVYATERCALLGDVPPCGVIAIPEVVDVITEWAAGNMSLEDVIAMINAWANSL